MERLDKQFAFFREIDKEKKIGRQTYLTGADRKENDAEHAWHMAIMTLLLSEYANEKIDVLKTVSMLLIHDLVEIDAGDTYAYDEAGKATQREREVKAADRIFSILPEEQGKALRALWEEFEARETPEAKFARTMDNIQPLMLNAATDGKAWEEHGVHLSQVLGRNERTAEGSEVLWKYAYETFIRPNVEKDDYRRMILKKIRLDKYLSDHTEWTRSQIKKKVASGLVKVQDAVIKDAGYKVSAEDVIEMEGQRICGQQYQYLLFHKPAGIVSATEDTREETVLDAVRRSGFAGEGEVPFLAKNLFPMGRLDKDTEGLLILTNDGELAHRLLSPKFHVEKTYLVQLDTAVSGEDVLHMKE